MWAKLALVNPPFLDAMCLALFNKIPRLKESDGKLLDVDGSELLTNSPLTVLRRGTGHGFAELCFVAQDQKHYQARWEIKRARENDQWETAKCAALNLNASPMVWW